MDRSQKSSKKACIMCFKSPQNILVLACDHTVCLQCAYVTMTHRGSSSYRSEIDFSCSKCQQITYFDKELIKQIEISIQPLRNHKYTEQMNQSKSPNFTKEVQQSGESFIQKIRNQYFSQIQPRPSFQGNKKNFIQNHYQNLQEKIKNVIQSDKMRLPQTEKVEIREQVGKQHTRIPILKQKTNTTQVKKNPITNYSQQTKCKSHPYYELIYFCIECREVVCPQCLLRGQHKDHKNQSISQILQKELPDFINHASQKFLKQVHQLQQQKYIHLNEFNHKLNQIKEIRQNAAHYFAQVRKNLEKEERQVLEKCDQLLKNLKAEEKQNQQKLKQMEIVLSKNIEEIKSLKTFYKEFSNFQSCDTQRKDIQKSLIHKYLSCLKSVNSFLGPNISSLQTQSLHQPHYLSYKNESVQNHLTNESELLNKRIQEGIQSIRQSLVFETFSRPINFSTHQNRKKSTQFHSRITTKMQPTTQNDISKKSFNQKEYISYVSTQNSHSKSKQLKAKSREKSGSISPYKGELSTQKLQVRKSILPFKKSNLRETTETEKQNILFQQDKSLVTEMKTELSTQNVSAKKYYNGKYQKSRQNSKSKSKNNQTAKSKKRNSNCYNSVNAVNRFKV